MVSETEIILAFLFKRSGKEELSFSNLYLNLSMDLNWFTPDDAKAFVNMAIKNNLLTQKGELTKPTFDFKQIVVPVGFFPSKTVFGEKEVEIIEEKEILSKIVQRIAEKTKITDKEILEKIKAIVKEKNINTEVAVLLICKEYNINFDDFIEEIEEKLF